MHQGYNVSKLRLIGEVLGILIIFLVIGVSLTILTYLTVEGFSYASLEAFRRPESLDQVRFYTILTQPFSMLATVGIVVLFLNARGIELYELGLKPPIPWKKTLALGAATMAALFAVTIGIQAALAQIGIEPELEDFAVIQGKPLLFLFSVTMVAWVGAGFGEEVLFRGFIMKNLQAMFKNEKIGWAAANVLQAGVFALLHLNQGLAGAIPVFAIALLFGYVFIRFGKSLWPLIVAHGLFDTVGLTLLYFGVTGF
jgi:CAAX protease family protein